MIFYRVVIYIQLRLKQHSVLLKENTGKQVVINFVVINYETSNKYSEHKFIINVFKVY